jgi:hypothetical protein
MRKVKRHGFRECLSSLHGNQEEKGRAGHGGLGSRLAKVLTADSAAMNSFARVSNVARVSTSVVKCRNTMLLTRVPMHL